MAEPSAPVLSADTRLSRADQALVLGLTSICLPVFRDAAWDEMMLAAMPGMLGEVTRGHVYLDPVVAAAVRLLAVPDAAPGERRIARARATMECDRALAEFWRWRAAQAHEAWAQGRDGKQGVAA